MNLASGHQAAYCPRLPPGVQPPVLLPPAALLGRAPSADPMASVPLLIISYLVGAPCMISGSLVALVTPMDSRGNLDWQALDRLIEFHLNEGTDGIVAVGTTGESATPDMEEHKEVIRRVVDKVAGRIPGIAGTGANSTSEAVELSQDARSVGADACLLVTAYYNKPTQEGLHQHFRFIAEAVDIPQILYNVPGRTACDMLPDTVVRLADIDNIIGI